MDWTEDIVVRRAEDKSSPAWPGLRDRFRSWWLLRHPRISAGRNIVVKEKVEISICETGRLRVGDHCFIHAEVWLLLTMPCPQVTIGKWVFIGRNTIVASKNKISIGDYTVIAPRCYFVDHEHGFQRDDIILNQRAQLKEIRVGRDCYFGTGATVLGGVEIGDGAIIGAGSVVAKDIPAYEVWAGNPARFVRVRS